MNEPKKSERVKTKILRVDEIKKIGERQTPKLPILAQYAIGERQTQCFDQPLFEVIQSSVGRILDCDVVTSVSGDFTNRTIKQVYINGQPVLQRQRGGGGGFSSEAAQILADAYLKATALKEVGLAGRKQIGIGGGILSGRTDGFEDEGLEKAYVEAIRSILANGKPAGRYPSQWASCEGS